MARPSGAEHRVVPESTSIVVRSIASDILCAVRTLLLCEMKEPAGILATWRAFKIAQPFAMPHDASSRALRRVTVALLTLLAVGCSCARWATRTERDPFGYIVVLVPDRLDPELGRMATSLRLLRDGDRTPVLLFHEPSLDGRALERQRVLVATESGRVVRTAAVDLDAPPIRRQQWAQRHNASASKHRSMLIKTHGLGYRAMCDFMFRKIMYHPALAYAKFMLRLDTDSRLEGEWPDIFALLEQRPQIAYVANPLEFVTAGWRNADCGAVVRGLREPALGFAAGRGRRALSEPISSVDARPFEPEPRCVLQPGWRTHPAAACCVRAYYMYTNFEVLRLDAFRQSAIFRAWSAAVTESGGVFKHRWGDAPLRRVSLNLMRNLEGWQRLGGP